MLNDVQQKNTFVADAVKEKLERDLREKLQKDVVDPILDKVIDDLVGTVDMQAYTKLDPDFMAGMFEVNVKKQEPKDQ